jgi:serine/threonine protein phosphatase 1
MSDVVSAKAGPSHAWPIVYGIGDIHGMRAELDSLLDMIDAYDQVRPKTLVFLRDLVKRGRSSRKVFERLIEEPRQTRDAWIVLRDNHDELFLDAVAGKSEAALCELPLKGSAETIASFLWPA